MKSEQNKLNATQKLEALESKIASLEDKLNRTIELVFNRINSLADTDVALAKRINAIVKAGDEGGVSSESVKNAVVNQAAQELKAKVDMLIENKLLVRDDSASINENSFVVGRELSSEGEVINPRIQFAVKSLADEAKASVLGKKAGESIPDEQSKTSMEIVEIYTIQEPEIKTNMEEGSEAPVEEKSSKKKAKKA